MQLETPTTLVCNPTTSINLQLTWWKFPIPSLQTHWETANPFPTPIKVMGGRRSYEKIIIYTYYILIQYCYMQLT